LDSAIQCAPLDPIGLSPARTSWSTSTRLAAFTVTQKPTKSIEELVPAPYHQYLPMLKNSASQGHPGTNMISVLN
ncbi:polyprotein, partial [Puccinia sorghi]